MHPEARPEPHSADRSGEDVPTDGEQRRLHEIRQAAHPQPDGEVCGSWEHSDVEDDELGLWFQIEFTEDETSIVIDGSARVDDRLKKSSLEGVATISVGGQVVAPRDDVQDDGLVVDPSTDNAAGRHDPRGGLLQAERYRALPY